MLKRTKCSALVLALALAAGTCFAQSPEPSKFYKLDFTVKEVEGSKVFNARSYLLYVSTDSPSFIRTGSKVPIFTSTAGSAFTSIDVGVSIDCKSIKEVQHDLLLYVVAEISSTLPDTPASSYPFVRQNKWSSSVLVPIKKPTVVFSSDDTTDKRQMQLEVTATPIP